MGIQPDAPRRRAPSVVGMSHARSAPNRAAGSADTIAQAVADFLDAQQRVLDRYRVEAERRLVVPTVGGVAQVLVAGEGPPLPMVIGGPCRPRSGCR